MTPLATKVARELSLKVKDRTFIDAGNVLPCICSAQFFEVTEIYDLAMDLARSHSLENLINQTFLPAPVTWVEWKSPKNIRHSLVIEENIKDKMVVSLVVDYGFCSMPYTVQFTELGALFIPDSTFLASVDNAYRRFRKLERLYDAKATTGRWLLAVLAIINTPGLIGRKSHAPNAALERALIKGQAITGRFPLRAWTELKLSVSRKLTHADGSVHEQHYTGRKCLHFCRAHLRVVAGRCVLVKAHWRGDPALGLKRTRYAVVK